VDLVFLRLFRVSVVLNCQQQQQALDILGLFVLNRFRQFKYEEVIAMLHFDFMDTVAGQQVYEMGGIDFARDDIIEVLDERFGIVPNDTIKQIRSISLRFHLRQLLRQAFRCSDIEGFKEMLSKVLPTPKKPKLDKQV